MYSEKLPPHDIDAEEAVIGSLLIDGTTIYQIAGLLQQQDFYREQNQWLYGACLSLYQHDEAINQITVAQELDRQGKLEACGGAAYLSHLISIVPTSLDIEHYAKIVYRLSVMRQLIKAADQIAAVGYEAAPMLMPAWIRQRISYSGYAVGRAPETLSMSVRCWTSILRPLPPLEQRATLSQSPMCCQVLPVWMNSWADSSALT